MFFLYSAQRSGAYRMFVLYKNFIIIVKRAMELVMCIKSAAIIYSYCLCRSSGSTYVRKTETLRFFICLIIRYSPLGTICYPVFLFYFNNSAFNVCLFSPRKSVINLTAVIFFIEIINHVWALIGSS